MTAARVGQMYKCVVTGADGQVVESKAAAMTEANGIVIVKNPADVAVAVKEVATFTVEAEGNGLTYQWMYSNNGGATWSKSSLEGNDTATVSVAALAFRNGQMYKCVVCDATGAHVESAPATLTIG